MPYQQLCKYEKGANCVTAGRLHRLARALKVDVGYFFEDVGPEGRARAEPPEDMRTQQRRLSGLMRHAANIGDPRYRKALCQLARALAALGADVPDNPQVEQRRPPPEPQSGPDR